MTVIAIQLPYRLELLFSKKESSDMMYSLPKDLLTHLQSIVSKFTDSQWSKKQEHEENSQLLLFIVRHFINHFNQTEIEKSSSAYMFLQWGPEIRFESGILHCYSKCRKLDKMSFLSRGRQIFLKHTHATYTPLHSDHTKTSSDSFLDTGHKTTIHIVF